jgi:hypothetical protein
MLKNLASSHIPGIGRLGLGPLLLTALHRARFEGPEQALADFGRSARYPIARIFKTEAVREPKFFAQQAAPTAMTGFETL